MRDWDRWVDAVVQRKETANEWLANNVRPIARETVPR